MLQFLSLQLTSLWLVFLNLHPLVFVLHNVDRLLSQRMREKGSSGAWVLNISARLPLLRYRVNYNQAILLMKFISHELVLFLGR
jgi:hypothetical protein